VRTVIKELLSLEVLRSLYAYLCSEF
jgi:hypothetical protein